MNISGAGSLILSGSSAPASSKIKIVPTDELPPPPPGEKTSGSAAGEPGQFALYPAYPNPFNPSAEIKFDLNQRMRVSLKVYNTLGQHVATLIDNYEFSAGTHREIFNASNLASGIYFYRISAHGEGTIFTDTGKMLLLR